MARYHGVAIVILLNIATLLDGARSASPKTISATYQIKTATITGVEYKAAVFSAEFDQDLFVLDNFPCQCGVCSTNTLTNAPNENAFNITALNRDQWSEGELIGQYAIQYYYFDIDSTQLCSHVTIELEIFHGHIAIVVATGRVPSLADYDWYRPITGRRMLKLCNSNPQFGSGRFYMGVIVNINNEYNRYRIRYITSANPDCPVPTPVPSISIEYPAGFQWLQDGQATRGFAEPEVYQYYGYQIETQCTKFAVSIQKNSTLQGDADLYMSVDNKPMGYGHALDPRRDWVSNNDGDDVISIQYCHDSSPPFTMFMAVTAYDVAVGYDIIATTQNDFVLWPVSGLALNSPSTHLAHSYRLECTSSDGTGVEQFFCEYPSYLDCYRDSEFYCCFPFYPTSAITTPNPLWPWNPADTALNAFANVLWDDQDYNKTHKANELSIALMMSQKDGDNFDLFVQTSELSNCKVIWTGQITNSQGEAILDELSFTEANPDCTTSFSELVESSAEIINKMSQSVNYLELTKAHYELNFKFFMEDWQGCNNFVAKLGTTTDFTTTRDDIQVCLRYPNSEEYAKDPCCNPDLLIDQCCSSTALSFSTLLLGTADSSAIKSTCATPSCSTKQFDNLIRIQRGIVDPDTGCTATFRREANTERYNNFLSFINECQYSILGETLAGISCTRDSECFSGVCNRTTGQCAQGNAELVDCLVSRIDNNIARFMFNNWGLKENVTKSVFTQQLVSRYTMDNACVGPTGIDYREHYLYGIEEYSCSDSCTAAMEPRCLDTSCTIPAECDFLQSGTCYRSYRLIQGDNSQCLNDKTCNWRSCEGLSSAQCQTDCSTFVDPQFCGDCSSGTLPCTEVAGLNETLCSEGICDIEGVALDVCTLTGVCTAQCGTGACANETQCQQSGVCSDKQVFTKYLAQFPNATGVCLKQRTFRANFIASCNADEVDTTVGCAMTTYFNESACTSDGHKWWTWATDQNSCLSFQTCSESIFTNSFVTWKSKEECDSCGGEFENAFTWSQGEWRLGSIRPLVWMNRQFVSVNKYGTSFDIIAFRNDVSSAIVSKLSTAYTTEAVCRYGGSVTALESLVCDCNSALNTGNCYADLDTSTLIGVLRACPYVSSSITASIASLTVFSNTISTDSFCKPVQVSSTSAVFYTSDSGVALSSEIYNKRIPNDYSVVRNSIGGTVGQLVSDGIMVSIDLSDGTSLIAPFQLCIDINEDISQADEYSVLGFGQLSSDGTIVVLDTEVTTSDSNTVCARVYNGTYFVIARLDDWENVQPYDELQATLKWVGLALYFVVVLFGIFQVVFVGLNYRSLVRGKQKIVFVSVVLGFNTLRGVYFALPVNSFKDFYIVQYLLFELPTFMFFTIYTIILYLWSGVLIKQSVLSKGKARGRLRRVKTVYIVVNAVMYAVFVLLVLLNQFLPQSQTDCRIGSTTNANSTRFYIILSYQIFIAAVCFGVSLAFMIQGIQFIIIFRKAKMVNTSGSKDKRRNLITFIAVTCTALFIGRTIVFLYAAVTGNPVTIIIFVLFEVLPSLSLLYYLRPYNWQHPFTTAKNSSTDGNSSKTRSRHSSSLSRAEAANALKGAADHIEPEVPTKRKQPGSIRTQKSPVAGMIIESTESSKSEEESNEMYPISEEENQQNLNEEKHAANGNVKEDAL